MRQGTFIRMKVDSPIGPLDLTGDGEGLCGVHMRGHAPAPSFPGMINEGEDAVLVAAARQLAEYFAGTRRRFDLPLSMAGTEFQRRVWAGLLTIGFGERSSYGALAREIGAVHASRAVGSANRCNPMVEAAGRVEEAGVGDAQVDVGVDGEQAGLDLLALGVDDLVGGRGAGLVVLAGDAVGLGGGGEALVLSSIAARARVRSP
jgi:methylated-DNA-[protein]-cysteine S-methyltransferase